MTESNEMIEPSLTRGERAPVPFWKPEEGELDPQERLRQLYLQRKRGNRSPEYLDAMTRLLRHLGVIREMELETLNKNRARQAGMEEAPE